MVTIKDGKYNREQLELEIKMLKSLVDDLGMRRLCPIDLGHFG
ncbi:hypothetical protein [Brucella oryzae]|nr:hypothetical protein [Brucella oryzae]